MFYFEEECLEFDLLISSETMEEIRKWNVDWNEIPQNLKKQYLINGIPRV